MPTQPALPDIDWSDVCGDVEPEPRREPRVCRSDLWACGLDADQIRNMTTVNVQGSYL
jgi:hypothetical protein